MERWATFDCYGTLIDWNGGLRLELARVFGEDVADAKLDEYHQVEPGLEAPAGQEYGLAESLPAWRPFSEVPHTLEELRRRGWKLALLSNTDDDLIAASQVQLGMVFDEAVVAQEIGSFKPGHKHWDEFFSRTRAPREGHVHVAASLFHDIAPCNELGLRSVWINRLGETVTDGARPTRELVDLLGLPETLDELVHA
jgi:2-haloacid dehalogenase